MFKIGKICTIASTAVLLVANSSVGSEGEKLCEGFAPENKMYIPVGKSNKGITEDQFNLVLNNFEAVFGPQVEALGAKLDVQRKWSDGTVNAYAFRSGNTWSVAMFGGLARAESVTMDGFLVVACHELGHHIGGAPKKGWFSSWASNEGQSDYYGTLKCFRKMAEANMLPPEDTSLVIPAFISASCQAAHVAPADQKLCERSAMAGYSVSVLLNSLSNGAPISFETRDPRVVSSTDHNHPKAQCRLDTYLAGSLCPISHHDDVSQSDTAVGTCNKASHPELPMAWRSACWFKEPAPARTRN